MSTMVGTNEPGSRTKLAPIPLVLPVPSFLTGGPLHPDWGDPHVEPLADGPRPPFVAPVGVTNLALHKSVTSSAKVSIPALLSKITDGQKEPYDEAVVELPHGKQWVQIDLEGTSEIYAIVIWHDQRHHRVLRCVAVQVADHPAFTTNVHTLFNNDYANLLGLGQGADKQYHETHQGKLIDAKGLKARYVRCYSFGSDVDLFNGYTEIEVWGLPGRWSP
ncbi:MAG: hypothetical protein ACLQVX_04400 [Limisphaerales bacterium]